MKLLQAYASLIKGIGIANSVLELSNNFVKLNHEVSILTSILDRTDFDKNIKISLLNFMGHYYPTSFFDRYILSTFSRIFFVNKIKKINPDLSILWYPPLDRFVIENKYSGKLIYYYFSVTDPQLYKGAEKERRLKEIKKIKLNLEKVDQILVPSKFIYKKLKENDFEGLIVPPGVNLQIFNCNRKKRLDNLSLLHVGRLAPHKGSEFLLNAFRKIRKEFPKAVLYIIGKKTEACYFKRISKLAQEIGNVIFLGEIFEKDLADWYASCDLFVCGSLYEGFGLPFLEAQACGTPCIGFNICSIPEVVENNKTGILVPPRNTNALADAVISLLVDENKRKKMSENALRHASKFDWFKIAQQHIGIYKNLL